MRTHLRNMFPLLVLPLLFVIACGASQSINTPNAPAPVPQGSGGSSGAQAGVTVTTGSSEVNVGQTVDVTIANDMAETIYTADMKSACGIAILERRVDDGWEALIGCIMERSPMVVSIAPGGREPVHLDLASSHFAAASGGSESAVKPGTYRIRFTYRLEPGREGTEDQSAVSDTFTIKG